VTLAGLDTAIAAGNFAVVAWYLHAGTALPWSRRLAAMTAAVILVGSALGGAWTAVIIAAAELLLLLRDWWNRKGRKVARQIGAKGRAVLAAVVAKAREAGTPLPEGAAG